MDRAERLISNSGSRRLVISWLAGIVFAGIGSWLLSGRIAGHIISAEIRTVLGVAGGGSIHSPSSRNRRSAPPYRTAKMAWLF